MDFKIALKIFSGELLIDEVEGVTEEEIIKLLSNCCLENDGNVRCLICCLSINSCKCYEEGEDDYEV